MQQDTSTQPAPPAQPLLLPGFLDALPQPPEPDEPEGGPEPVPGAQGVSDRLGAMLEELEALEVEDDPTPLPPRRGDIPHPPEGQEWTIEASERQCLARSPKFCLQLPSVVIGWVKEGTSPNHDDRQDHIQDRIHWIVRDALDAHTTTSPPPAIPPAYFARGGRWSTGYITLDAEHTYHLRLWARRIDKEAGSLLAALICQAHQCGEGRRIRPHFALELIR